MFFRECANKITISLVLLWSFSEPKIYIKGYIDASLWRWLTISILIATFSSQQYSHSNRYARTPWIDSRLWRCYSNFPYIFAIKCIFSFYAFVLKSAGCNYPRCKFEAFCIANKARYEEQFVDTSHQRHLSSALRFINARALARKWRQIANHGQTRCQGLKG